MKSVVYRKPTFWNNQTFSYGYFLIHKFSCLKIGSTFKRINFNHVVWMISYLCFSKTRDTKITLSIDIFYFSSKNHRSILADSVVYSMIFRQPFLKMNNCSVCIEKFKKGNGTHLRINPNQATCKGKLG